MDLGRALLTLLLVAHAIPASARQKDLRKTLNDIAGHAGIAMPPGLEPAPVLAPPRPRSNDLLSRDEFLGYAGTTEATAARFFSAWDLQRYRCIGRTYGLFGPDFYDPKYSNQWMLDHIAAVSQTLPVLVMLDYERNDRAADWDDDPRGHLAFETIGVYCAPLDVDADYGPTVILHELAHHYMYFAYGKKMPKFNTPAGNAWGEGFAYIVDELNSFGELSETAGRSLYAELKAEREYLGWDRQLERRKFVKAMLWAMTKGPDGRVQRDKIDKVMLTLRKAGSPHADFGEFLKDYLKWYKEDRPTIEQAVKELAGAKTLRDLP